MFYGNQLFALNGCLLVDSGAAVTGKDFCYITVNADAVLTKLTGIDPGGNSHNLLTEFNLGTKTLGQGTSLGYYKITEVTVASGSVICYNR